MLYILKICTCDVIYTHINFVRYYIENAQRKIKDKPKVAFNNSFISTHAQDKDKMHNKKYIQKTLVIILKNRNQHRTHRIYIVP